MEADEGLCLVRLQAVVQDLPSPLRDDVISLATVFNLSWNKFRSTGPTRIEFEKRLISTIRADWHNLRISSDTLLERLREDGAKDLAEEISVHIKRHKNQDPGTSWLDHIDLCSDWFELLQRLGLLARANEINSYYPLERAVRDLVFKWLGNEKGTPTDKMKAFTEALKTMGCDDIEGFLPKFATKGVTEVKDSDDKPEAHKQEIVCSVYTPEVVEELVEHSLTVVNTDDVIFPPDVELVSHVICVDITIHDAKEEDVDEEEDGVFLALVHTGAKFSTQLRDVGIYVYNVDGTWETLPTEQLNVKCKSNSLILTKLDPGCCTLAVLSEPKSDHHMIGREASVLTSSVDPNVAVSIPDLAFLTTANLYMQIDKPTVTPECAQMVGLKGHSTLLQITTDEAATKPLDFQLPMAVVGKQRMKKQPIGSQLYLAMRRGSGAWTSLEGKDVNNQNQCASFQHVLERATSKYVVIEAEAELSNREVEERAEALDDSSRMDVVSIVARPHYQRRLLYVEVVKRAEVQEVISGLERLGFDEFPLPSEEFQIKDGESIEIRLKGEVRFSTGGKTREKIYHSNIRSTRLQEEVKFKGRSGRMEEDFYTCKIRAFLPVDPDVPLCSIPIQYPKMAREVLLDSPLPSEAPDPSVNNESDEDGNKPRTSIDLTKLQSTKTKKSKRVFHLSAPQISKSTGQRASLTSTERDINVCGASVTDVVDALVQEYDMGRDKARMLLMSLSRESKPGTKKKKQGVIKKLSKTPSPPSPYETPPRTAYEVLMTFPSVTNNWQSLARNLRVADRYIAGIETSLLPNTGSRMHQMLVLWQCFYKKSTVWKLKRALNIAGQTKVVDSLKHYKIKKVL